MKYFFGLLIFLSIFVNGQTTFSNLDINVSNVTDSKDWGSGVSAEDFDNDGDLDIAVCADKSNRSRILINQGDNTFQNRYFDLNFNSRSALWIDYDGDHLLDLLFIGDCLGANDPCKDGFALFKQESNGNFTEQTRISFPYDFDFSNNGVFSGAASGDLNGDNFLDIIVVYSDLPSKYFENNGDGSFSLFEGKFDIGANKNWSPLLYDLDRDGWMDYYQASDLATPNQFWSHSGDFNFIEIAAEIGLDNAAEDMGVALGDYDNDNDLDLYVSNIQSEKFKRGNILLKNDDFTFTNVASTAGVENGGWSWGITFLDCNNDGFLDLAATNGWNDYDSSKLWINNGNSTFSDMSDNVLFNDTLIATSLISLDFDRDGDLDMIQTVKSEYHPFGFRFLQNQLVKEGDQNYIVVKPRMNGENHWAIGSLVSITTLNGIQIRPITAGISYFGQEPAEAFFGIGSVELIDEIEITWPGGGKTSITNVLANQVIEINDTGALHPPKNLNVVAVDKTSFQLNWDSSSGVETEYVVERSTNNQFIDFSTFIISNTTTEYIDNGLDSETTYYYRVRAKKDTNVSRSTLHVKAKYTEHINTPGSLRTEKLSINSVLLSWTDMSDNEEGFRIQRSAQKEFEDLTEFEIPANSNFFIDSDLEPNAVYYYRVLAFSSYGISDFSEVIMIDLSQEVLSVTELNDVVIYPNPSSGVIHIHNKSVSIERIVLKDLHGQILTEFDTRYSSFLLDSSLSKGIYLLQLKIDSEWKSMRLVIK